MKNVAEVNPGIAGVEPQTRIEDLSPGGVELLEEDLRAVSGGRMPMKGSWTSGSSGKTDEWTL